MKQDRESIAFKLKEVRRKLKLTQEDLAHKLGVSFTSVNRWENEQTKPSKLAKNQIYYNSLAERMNGKFQNLKNVIRGGN